MGIISMYKIYNMKYIVLYRIYVIYNIRRAFGPGRVRSWARTPFLVFWLTPLPPQWTLGVQITRLNQLYCLLRATLKITETCTGAEPNRPDQRTIMNKIIVEIY